MFVRGQSFLSGLGEFPGIAYAGRNAAEVRAMERCLSQGGRCRVLPPGATTPGYWSQEGLCPGPANVQCVFPLEEGASPQGSSAPAPRPQPGHEAGHTSILNSLFNRPGGSAPPGMPGNVNVAPGQPPVVDQSAIMRTFSPPIGGMSTGAKWAMAGVAAIAAIALAIAIFKKPKGAAKTSNRRRRRNTSPKRRNGRVFARQRRVAFNENDIRDFRAVWPASGLHGMKRVWFEFDSRGDLVDTGPSTRKYDGPALSALAGDAQAWLFQGKKPYWMSR